MATGDVMGYATYVSDNGTTYFVKTSQINAVQGGFGSFQLAPPNLPAWPWLKKDLRHVTGKSAGGKRASLACGTPSNALYTTGGTFTIDAGTFTVLGHEGERRVANHIR